MKRNMLFLRLLAIVDADGRYSTQGIAYTVQQGWVPGDERAAALLSAALVLCADEETHTLLGERPTIFFGLVTLARALNLPPGGAIALFALGRTIGWIGHSIEQYQANQVIRPRARYVGPAPHD
jgi:citrate synthase